MKLTKSIDNHDIAHLYEHLFSISLDTVLRENGLYPIIDYSIDAYTEEWLVTFDIETYRNIDLDTVIAKADEHFLEPSELLDIARRQLEAEYSKAVAISNPEEMTRVLHNINQARWNEDALLHTPDSLLTIGNSVDAVSLYLTIATDNVSKDLKPLFRLVAGVTINTTASDIADTFGGFVANEAFAVDEEKSLIAHILLSKEAQENEIDDLIKETLNELSTDRAYARLIDDLKNISTMTYPPSPERTLEDTGVLMDGAKWKELATYENLQSIIKLIRVKIHYKHTEKN